MAWHIGMLPPETSDLGAIAHGPAVLARSPGLQVGLRTIIAYKGGLELAVMVIATGAHADVAERQYRAPAEIDPVTGRPNPQPVFGVAFRFSAADDSTEQPFPRRSTAARSKPGVFRREFLYTTSELPRSTLVRYLVAWPQVGLSATTVELTLPDPDDLRRHIIPMPN